MATFQKEILDLLPDPDGPVNPEPASVNFGANDRYPALVWKFPDSASGRDKLGFAFIVPQNYVGSPKFKVAWSTPTTAGNRVRLQLDYRAIAAAESIDPSTDQENLTVNAAPPATARDLEIDEMTATAANFAAGDLVIGVLARDHDQGTPNDDDVADAIYLFKLIFEYADA